MGRGTLNTILIFTVYLQEKSSRLLFRIFFQCFFFFTKLHGHLDGDDEFTSIFSAHTDVTQPFWWRLIQQLYSLKNCSAVNRHHSPFKLVRISSYCDEIIDNWLWWKDYGSLSLRKLYFLYILLINCWKYMYIQRTKHSETAISKVY